VSTSSPGAPPEQDSRISLADRSREDVSAALRANGVENAEQWAAYICADQPYSPDAAGQEKLTRALTNHGADSHTVDVVLHTVRP
jgi:hypothetical protein